MELGLVVPEADHLDDFTRKFLGTLPIQVTTRHQGAFADMLDREHCGSVAPELFWRSFCYRSLLINSAAPKLTGTNPPKHEPAPRAACTPAQMTTAASTRPK